VADHDAAHPFVITVAEPKAMNLLMRADASVSTGTGHVMRCLALAQAWQDAGGRVLFAMAQTTTAVADRLQRERAEVVTIEAPAGSERDAQRTTELARDTHADWVVVDGYQFDASYQRALKSAGVRILFLDDYGHAAHYSADIILNQNVCAQAELYSQRESHTRLLLGTRYCLLRREFSARRDSRVIMTSCRRVLVLMGGSDPENLTARVIEALVLANIENLGATVVVGGSNPHFDEVKKIAADSGLTIEVRRDVANLAQLLAEADVAISAAGSTCWELCMLGLPSLLIDVADNQTSLAEELNRLGCAIHMGNQTISSERIAKELQRLCSDGERRQILAERSRKLVDGKGASRVVSILRGTDDLKLRRVRAEDRQMLWEWANDPEVRAASFSSDPIPWETHVAWFAEKIGGEVKVGLEEPSSGNSLLLIGENYGVPVGQIRFDVRQDKEWEVDVSIEKAKRGCGLASELIRQGVEVLEKHVVSETNRDFRVHALVKAMNVASVKAFEQAGFKHTAEDQMRGQTVVHLVYE
jgi:UDP-2,4-diacetamido-2,4,6-trideoxy-beta-L-altropyranose hydrolase